MEDTCFGESAQKLFKAGLEASKSYYETLDNLVRDAIEDQSIPVEDLYDLRDEFEHFYIKGKPFKTTSMRMLYDLFKADDPRVQDYIRYVIENTTNTHDTLLQKAISDKEFCTAKWILSLRSGGDDYVYSSTSSDKQSFSRAELETIIDIFGREYAKNIFGQSYPDIISMD